MDIKNNYKKKLVIPDGFKAPFLLKSGSIEARPLTRGDLDEDLQAVNSSLQIIRDTRGGSWPEEELDRDFDFLDLAWHEREFRDNNSFAYVLRRDGKYVGCFYIYPIGERVNLNDSSDMYDADYSWWVTQKAFDEGVYEEVFMALQSWKSEFPFEQVKFSNKVIPKEK